ncbi:MAG: O-acetyl-ADP-ribose deacetylase [Deltaproteobacteria bacterium HGW-Deltaproteobacteria-10]|nr:MAG: O-acetyl-ADP-ribose deacetylase [Deltaproteobacteria bacterium HGW-Deltaproteobacteria-10]
MKAKINKTTIILACGDITEESTDAIVNAANNRLAGGAGVDGAIHRVGGPVIMQECRRIGGCPTGQAVITGGGNLKAKYVIHTVGPIYSGGSKDEAKYLQSSYRQSLILALENSLQSISFPAISTGVYGYPIDEAGHLALRTCIEFAREHTGIELIRHILYDLQTYEIFSIEFKKILSTITMATE